MRNRANRGSDSVAASKRGKMKAGKWAEWEDHKPAKRPKREEKPKGWKEKARNT